MSQDFWSFFANGIFSVFCLVALELNSQVNCNLDREIPIQTQERLENEWTIFWISVENPGKSQGKPFFFSFNSEKTSAKKISNKLSQNYELQTFVFIRIFNLNNCQNVAFQTFLQLSSLKALSTRNEFSDSIKYY